MSCTVLPGVEELGRSDRRWIEWPISGQSDTATVSVELEGTGTWWQLSVVSRDDGDWAQGWFAGPNYNSPGGAHVVTKTSHAVIRVTDTNISVTLDAGFIRLVP